jgi:hypothetical protein
MGYTLRNEIDAMLIKVNANGDSLWSRTFGGSQYYNELRSIARTTDDGFILAGGSICHECPYSSGNIMKIDDAGNRLWQRVISLTGEGTTNGSPSAFQTADRGYLIAGSTAFNVAYSDAMLIKPFRIVFHRWSCDLILWPSRTAGSATRLKIHFGWPISAAHL